MGSGSFFISRVFTKEGNRLVLKGRDRNKGVTL